MLERLKNFCQKKKKSQPTNQPMIVDEPTDDEDDCGGVGDGQ